MQLLDVVDADFAGVAHIARQGSEWLYGDIVGAGDARCVEHWEARIRPDRPWKSPWNPESPPPGAVNRFQTSIDARLPAHEPVLTELYDPIELRYERRMLVYDDRTFAGWLGLARREDHPFTAREERRLCQATARCRDMVVADRRVTDAAASELHPAHILLSAEGAVLSAGRHGARLLTKSRREMLRGFVRAADRNTECVCIADGLHARTVRLDGPTGVQYLVIFRAIERPKRSLLSALSPRQREVAELAATGATAIKIGQYLELSPHTVRQHLRAIYQRLGINSRSELASCVSAR
ncbi:MAG: helix-turn-helix transcriptional regulator [Deltaproteobacteria bacterium]|nr:helix-turn-helix transcriptional regulator [Deltaproteobacteria bacterium]